MAIQHIYDEKDRYPDRYEITVTSKEGHQRLFVRGRTHVEDWNKSCKVGDRVTISFTIKEITHGW